jgi:hypothetical protein
MLLASKRIRVNQAGRKEGSLGARSLRALSREARTRSDVSRYGGGSIAGNPRKADRVRS